MKLSRLSNHIKNTSRFVFALAPLFAAGYSCSTAGVGIEKMRCEYLDTPLGIDMPDPRFTWMYGSNDGSSDFLQAGFRINVASEPELLAQGEMADMWSAEFATAVPYAEYAGRPLEPHKWYYWNVTVKGADGENAVSPVAKFRTAKMSHRPEDWQAKWITDGHDMNYAPAPTLRRTFDVRNGVAEAYLYISAAGYYLAAINGENITPNRLDPAYTHYDKRNLYVTHDVTPLVKTGRNAISVVLGNGFYNEIDPVATWDFERARWRRRPRMICELHVEYTDGTKEVTVSDGSWRVAPQTPWVSNNIYSGDIYDARLEIGGWNEPDFDDGTLKNAVVAVAPSPLLVSQLTPAIRVSQSINPVAVRSWGDSLFVFDFGVNIAGVCEMKIGGGRGTRVTLRHGELLTPDGRLEQGNLYIYYKPLENLEFQTDTYILKGGGIETFTPAFTYHGFQYVEVRSDRPVKIESLTAQFLHTAVEPVGKFRSSNELFNKIWEATRRSYLSNLHGIPTDCPQREKNGWTADAWISMDIALSNYDGIKFYEKWLDDFIDNQLPGGRLSGIIPSSGWGYDDWIGPVWDAALFIVPDMLERYYGTTRYMERLYPTCERYLDYLATREEPDGTVTYGIGDWVYYKTQTPTDFTSSCFYMLDNRLMSEFAAKTGRDGSRYSAKADLLLRTINERWFDPDRCIYANGSQAALGVALALDIVPPEYRERVAANLNEAVVANDYYLDFGTLGSKFVPRMLTEYGYVDTAYKMATKEDEPSWGAWINQGFTTLAERWVLDLVTFRDSSINHVFLGDISAWMTQMLAGINADASERGFRRIVFEPHFPEGLDWVEAAYDSPAGRIEASWRRKGDKVKYEINVPVNVMATVRLAEMEYEAGAGRHTYNFKLN